MWTLGINSGLNASAVLLHDGRVIYGIQEERLCRIKNQPGFPHLSIDAALNYAGLTRDQVDQICVGGTSGRIIKTRDEDLQKYHERYMQIKNGWFGKTSLPNIGFSNSRFGQIIRGRKSSNSCSLDEYLDEFGFLERHVRFDHHTCHAASAYYGLAPDMADRYLVFTMDGGGDRKTSGVFLGENGNLQEIASSLSMSLASLYAHITYILGFLPHEHEYKLMGLAPYANKQNAIEIKDRLYEFVGFSEENNMILTNTEKYPNLDPLRGPDKLLWIENLYRTMIDVRFDTLCAGLQLFVEEMILRWIESTVESTGIRKVLLSGGFFMNVKANQLIAESEKINYVNCFPSCGDETNAFGAAFLGHQENVKVGGVNEVNFRDFCIGPESTYDLESVFENYSDQVEFESVDDINGLVVDLLCEGKILARCSGRMEFGARALGNRSILAAANDLKVIQRINHAIKKRDFWMPFAPVILKEFADKVVVVPDSLKSSYSPYMMFTFPVRPNMSDQIVAGIHQADKTARAQIVDQELYPELHDILERYHSRTNIPALLNTSFNLHGYPIVTGAMDAVKVFLDSDIDALVLDNWLVVRK